MTAFKVIYSVFMVACFVAGKVITDMYGVQPWMLAVFVVACLIGLVQWALEKDWYK